MARKVLIGVRFEEEIAKILEEISKNLGIDKSDFIRMAVREKLAEMSFLDEKTKKVFGIIKRGGVDEGN